MASLATLSSAKATLIRDLLRHKKARDAAQTFVIEGMKPIHELLRTQARSVEAIVVTPHYLDKSEAGLRRALEQGPAPTYICRQQVFDKISDVRTPVGILAIVRQPRWDQEEIFRQPSVFGLYGESLQDPANVGAIIRTAAAFGLDGVWLSADSADVFNPKVVRATAGTLLTLPIFSVTSGGRSGAHSVAVFARNNCALLVADPSSRRSRDIRQFTRIPARTILAFGNESRGLSEATDKQAALRFHIPVNRAVDSLNVAASAAIVMFYFSRLPRQGASP